MASLGMVCGLLEEGVIATHPETIAALKPLNEYFYSHISSSSDCPPSLGNVNKPLQKPETGDSLRQVLKVVLIPGINWYKENHNRNIFLTAMRKCCKTGDASLPVSFDTSGFV